MRALRLPVLAAFLALVAVFALVSVATGAGKRVGLDTSYGTEGVVMLNPKVPLSERTEAIPSPFASALGFAAAADGSAYVMVDLDSCKDLCRNGPAVQRYDPAGKADGKFGKDGRIELPKGGDHYTVGVDSAGRVLVAYVNRATLVVNRYGADGATDGRFGKAGTKILHCECGGGYRQVRWVQAPKGRMLLVVDRELPGYEGGGTQFEMFRFLAGGGLDPAFGRKGKVTYVSHQQELARAIVVAPSGAALIGGSNCCGARQIFLERVGPGGRPDHAFDRVASHSVRRLAALGEFPTLTAVTPGPGGGVVALGSSENREGFDLRLSRDGHLAKGFGRRGLARLPFLVDAAVPGLGGAIFALGEHEAYGRSRAYRVLANGRLDPSYNGGGGIVVPLPGEPARVTPIAPGKVLVTDKGDYECIRQCTPAEPGLARFLE